MVLVPDTEFGFLIGDNSPEAITLSPGQLNDFPFGVLTLGGEDTVQGSIDSELIITNRDDDIVLGGGGIDTIFGGKNNDSLDGQDGNDKIFGNLDNDTLIGGNGDDSLFGGKGNDQLFGGEGQDTLYGDLGADTLTGGTGSDIFALRPNGQGTDLITDFQDGVDLLQIPQRVGEIRVESSDSNLTQITVVETGEVLAKFEGIQPTQITLDDFVNSSNLAIASDNLGDSINIEVTNDVETENNSPSLSVDDADNINSETSTPEASEPETDSSNNQAEETDNSTPEDIQQDQNTDNSDNSSEPETPETSEPETDSSNNQAEETDNSTPEDTQQDQNTDNSDNSSEPETDSSENTDSTDNSESVEIPDGLIGQVIELTNDFRVDNGLEPLSFDSQLTIAAQDHTENMAFQDFFSHQGLDGSSVGDRISDTGYSYSTGGENIAAGYTTAESVVQGWIDSEGHRANLLNPNFTEIGVGYFYLENDTGESNWYHYWTQVFGTPSNSN